MRRCTVSHRLDDLGDALTDTLTVVQDLRRATNFQTELLLKWGTEGGHEGGGPGIWGRLLRGAGGRQPRPWPEAGRAAGDRPAMTATWRVGHGGAAGAQAMGEYLTTETLAPEPATAAAYYLGDVPARGWGFTDRLGQQIRRRRDQPCRSAGCAHAGRGPGERSRGRCGFREADRRRAVARGVAG